MRYFFHVKDGKEMLDEDGIEFSDMDAVKKEAVQASTELLAARTRPSSGAGNLGSSG